MPAKQKIAIGISAAALATALLTTFEPPNSADRARNERAASQNAGDLAHADELQKGRYLTEGELHGDAQNAQRLIPGEYRPREPPRIQIRILP